MKKIMFAAAALMAGLVMADDGITSANIVGYQDVSVPAGYSIFTVTFKNVGSNEKFDLKNLKPMDQNGKVLNLSDGSVFVLVLDDEGNYGDPINWYGKSGKGWSQDNGETTIADGAVMIGNGVGLCAYSKVKIDASGNESTARKDSTGSIVCQVSGEVDLTCKNAVIPDYSINGNSTPVSVNLKDVVPQDPNGKAINLSDGGVFVLLLDSEGNYGDPINWYGKSGKGWSQDNGETTIGDDVAVLKPGQGFAVYSKIKIDASGNESTARKDAAGTIYLSLPSPVEE